jgi:hypothetical protein
VNLTANQIHQIGELSDQWSFLWDKRRALWIAAEDCPDGEQVEDADLDVLLVRLPVIAAARLRVNSAVSGLTDRRAR